MKTVSNMCPYMTGSFKGSVVQVADTGTGTPAYDMTAIYSKHWK